MKRRLKRVTSLLCVFALCVGLLPTAGIWNAAGAEGGINGYQATMQADTSTANSWQDAFAAAGVDGAVNIGGTARSAALNGKVWADKSVTADVENKEFDVTLSALGQTFASKTTSQTEVAFDVVFVVDRSGSMNFGQESTSQSNADVGETRMDATVAALNSAAEKLMENGNNRMAVVPFNNAATGSWVELNHYTKNGNNSFFSYNRQRQFSFEASGTQKKSISVTGGTNQQDGFFKAFEILTSVAIPEESPMRIPVIIMLTDGTPDGDYATQYYKTGNSGDGSATPEKLDNDSLYNNLWDSTETDDRYYTICTAAYLKDQITASYKNRQNEQNVSAQIYTIGLGLSKNSDDHIMLDPKIRNTGLSNETISNHEDWSLSGTINDNSASYMGFTDYNYADDSFVGEMTEEQLQEAFNSIIDSITTVTGGVDVGEATGGRNKMTFFETLGDGVQFTGEMTLTVPTYTVDSDGQMKQGENRIYTLTPYASTTVSGEGGLSEGTEITTENGPAYVMAGGVVRFRPTEVNDSRLDSGNEYDQAALNDLSITVRLLSSGKRQMQADIPPKLMAYNVLNTETENGQSASTYYVSDGPVQLSYSVKMLPDAGSGSYLAGEPSQTYMHFIPSSAQTVEGTYDMPYYWPGGQFAEDPARVDKTGGSVAGASDYVSLTQMGQNNDVYIYLGNNGLYTLEGKDLTFHLFWDDSSNQDGQRFENIYVQLYREEVGTDSIQNPDSASTDAEEYGEPVSLGLSNVKDDDANVWEQVFSDLPVYSEGGQFYRYWLQFVPQEGEDDNRGYTVDINDSENHKNGVLKKTDSAWWFCFAVDEGLLTDAELDVKFARDPETINYVINKVWDPSTGDAETNEESVSIQLYANGKPVTETGAAVSEGDGLIEITRDDGWSKTLTLPRYANGEEILYTPVEQGDDYTAIVSSVRDDSSSPVKITATVTNYSSVDKTSLTAVKVWEDNNDQDGIRPASVQFKLKATVEAQTLSDAELAALIGKSEADLTQTVNASGIWRCTWNNLPKTSGGQPVTYSAEEIGVPEGYTSTSSSDIPNFVFVTNTHTPETVDITINKVWSDSENQDGIRPTGGVSGVLYEKAGADGTITALRSYAISGESVTISGLPKYENGDEIKYYVSENAVSGYTLSVEGVTAETVSGVNVYPVSGNSITLTNTHTPATQDYTASFTWDDNNDRDGQRPDSFTVTLTGTVSGKDETAYTFTLNVDKDGVTSVGTTDPVLPGGATAAVEAGQLKIIGLPAYDDGDMISYTMGNLEIDNDYSSSITGYTQTSTAFRLSYSSAPQTLGFTKVWNDKNKDAEMRPSTDAYARYLTLKADGEEVSAWPTVTQQGENYVVTYSNLPKWNEEGQQIAYTVTESAVPNYTADNYTVALTADKNNTITNTYSAEVYDTITVTKVWNDADGRDKRPEIPDLAEGGVDPLNIRLYETYGSQIDPAQGIQPDSIKDNGDNTWTYTWNDVPKTDADGSTIYYTAYENTIPTGYMQYGERDNNRFADIDADGQARSTIVNTLDGTSASTGTLTIEKVWADKDYENSRPDELSFTVTGTYEGSKNDISRTVTMSRSTGWSAVEVENLPLTVNGEKVTYTVTENDVPAGYTPSYKGNGVTLADASGNEATVTVTNTFAPDQWKLTYSANGGVNPPTDDKTYTPALNTATIAGPGKMSYDGYTFLGWTKEIHGVVTAAADVPPADELYIESETLSLNSDTTLYAVWAVDSNGDEVPDYDQKQITVDVVWDDDGNRCGIRPNEIGFTLDGESYTIDLADTAGVLVTTNDGNTKWIYTVPVLFDKEKAFTADTLDSVDVTAKQHADPADTTGYTSAVAWEEASDTYTVTLTHTPETTSHDVTKIWDFGQAAFTTGTATIQLLGNGQPAVNADGVTTDEITFVPNGTEDLTWTNLPKYEGGKLITYHAVETQVLDDQGKDVSHHFKVEYDWSTPGETHITNTYSELRDITLLYQWDDGDDAAGQRPTDVTIQLYADGQPVSDSERTISEKEEWNVTWNDLRMYSETAPDRMIQYEARVISYTDAQGVHPVDLGEGDQTLDGSDYSFSVMSFGTDSVFVMNSALDNETSFTVTKDWTDEENKFNTRPESVWINLLQNGAVFRSAEVKASENWTYTWTGLPAAAGGQTYTYTVSEIPVPGYTAAVTGNQITNSLDALTSGEQLTVTFVYNNGQADTQQQVDFGGSASPVDPEPAWEGHAFKGWYTDNGTFADPYDFSTPVTQDITLYAKWVSVHDGQEDPDDHHFLTFVYENTSAKDKEGNPIDTGTDKIRVECGSDYSFTASANSGYILNTPSVEGSAKLVSNGNNGFTLENITSDITVTIKADRQSNGGGGGGSTPVVKPELEKGDHFAYIVGYEDETVRPGNDITRAEVATIFFRLLTEESRDEFFSDTNSFSDISADAWYNNAVSTLTNAGIISGYPDGTFRPDAAITRAELAAIASRFDELSGGESRLTDISGHWAEDYINSAYSKGWVDGYPDGTFRPDQNITRAEVMTLVNRVLERAVDIDGMLEDMVTWTDNQPDSWFYEAVQEATNSHDYSREEGEEFETWTEITPPRDWTELEK